MGRLKQTQRSVAAIAIAAVVLWCVQLSGAATPAAHATPGDLGQQVQGQVVAGSEIHVYVLDHLEDKLAWQGVLEGPTGTLQWDQSESHGQWTKVGVYKDVEAGEYTAIPAVPIAPGWEVYGYSVLPGSEGNVFSCGTEAADYTDDPTFELSEQEDFWTVCIGVKIAGGLTGSLFAVQFVGPTVAGPWNGTVNLAGQSVPLNDFMISGSTLGWWWNGKPGNYSVMPTGQPKAGLYTYGLYLMAIENPVPTCPNDPSLYTPGGKLVTVSELKPRWAICVMVVDNFDGQITLKVDGPVGEPWAGTVSGTGGFTSTWVAWGVDATSVLGTKDGLLPGSYGFHGAQPVAPGWSLVGLAAFESQAIDPACPGEIGAYQYGNWAFVSPSAPAWAVCAKVAPLEVLPGTRLGLNILSASRDGVVDGPTNYDFDFMSMGINIASTSGSRSNIPVGSYKVVPEAPAGTEPVFHAFVTDDNVPLCPSDLSLYSAEAHTVEVSAQEPIWMVCVRFVALPEPNPVQDPPPADPPAQNPPAQSPGGNSNPPHAAGDPSPDPDPVATPYPPADPSPASPPATPADPNPPAADPTPTTPAQPAAPVGDDAPPPEPASGNPGGVLNTNPTPIAPSTGNGMAGANGPSTMTIGLILVALATAAVAAGWLPSRRKR